MNDPLARVEDGAQSPDLEKGTGHSGSLSPGRNLHEDDAFFEILTGTR